MAASIKLQDIDQKIKDLQDKKKQLEQKQLADIARLVKRLDADKIPVEILIGGITEIVKAVRDKSEKTKEWAKSGQDHLNKMSRGKEGEEASSSFPDSADEHPKSTASK